MSKHLHKASSFEHPNLLRPRPSVAARKRKSCGRVFARSKSHQSFRSVSFSIVVQRKIDWITRVEFFRNPPLALPLRAIDIFPRIDASAISTSIGMTKTKLQRRFMIGEALHTALTERRYSSIQPIHRLQNLAELGIIH
jgi:hypothetical protein